jgi:hypothetical protein
MKSIDLHHLLLLNIRSDDPHRPSAGGDGLRNKNIAFDRGLLN